jgi:hypothetical protein
MLKRSDQRALHAHIWSKDPDGFYVEPHWCGERLFAVERFDGRIHDPACGLGRIADAARVAGYKVIATDLIDRGYPQFDGVEDFLRSKHCVDNIVCNPPYHICRAFAEHALKLARRKVAMIWLARRLNAARWLANTPLAHVYLMSPRPSMPPGRVILAGEKPGGGKQDFVWLVFSHGHRGPSKLHWLSRESHGGHHARICGN